MYNYESVRYVLKTGDLIAFQRIPWRWKYLQPTHWAYLGGYLSNVVITISQWIAMPGYDGFCEFIHCGVVVRDYLLTDDIDRPDEVLLVEVMARGVIPDIVDGEIRRGLTISFLSDRVKDYWSKGGRVAVFPIRESILMSDYESQAFQDRVDNFIRELRKYRYNYWGLIWSVVQRWWGLASPGKMFCSEAVVNFWLKTKILHPERKIKRHNHFILWPYSGHEYAPLECARMHEVIDAQGAMFVNSKGITEG